MGATNKTTYYELSQFIGTDKPAWLQDYNGDMLKIDTGINAAKVAADNAANAASAAQGDATTALGGVSSLNTTVGTISTTLGTAVGNINTINSLIGNGTPTTTDQTIIGAINELHSDILDLSGTGVSSFLVSVTPDGVKSYKTLLEELFLQVISEITNRGCDAFTLADLYISSWGAINFVSNRIFTNAIPIAEFGSYDCDSSGIDVKKVYYGSGSVGEMHENIAGVYTSLLNDIPAASVEIRVRVIGFKNID